MEDLAKVGDVQSTECPSMKSVFGEKKLNRLTVSRIDLNLRVVIETPFIFSIHHKRSRHGCSATFEAKQEATPEISLKL